MASLAEELDPAFNDTITSNDRDDHDQFDEEDRDERYDYAYGQSVSSTSSTPVRPTKRSHRRYRTRGTSDTASHDAPPVGHHADGFSLADELGDGSMVASNSQAAVPQGVALADEFATGVEPLTMAATERKSGTIIDDETRARRDQEHYLVSSEVLNESGRQTESFLRTLQKTMMSTAAAAAPATVSSKAHVSQLPSSVSTNSLSAGGDDTAGIEQAAAGIVRQLREQAQLREGQIRDLQECDRIIRRAFEEGGEYLMALAETHEAEETKEEEEEYSTDTYDRDPLGLGSVNNGMGEKASDELLDSTLGSEGGAFALQPRQSHTMPPSGTGSTMHDLVKLQQSTTDLVYSLSAIHEHNQIAHATLSEATRKLRNVRAVLTNWQDEVRVQEKSNAWIAAHELQLKMKSSDRPTDVRTWMQDEMDQFEFALEEAHIKARQLLIPVRDPVLDRLAASATTAKA